MPRSKGVETDEPVIGQSAYEPSIDEEIRRCTKCRLHESRRHAVPGTGNRAADIMFIGEGPGEQEDLQGLPFVGKAGQLLTKMLAAIELKREEVFITNIVKCRPPGNRNPQPDEVDDCFPYLERQIAGISPLVIICLGGPAAKAVLKSSQSITRLRGQFYRYGNIPVLATYHPAAVLRFPEKYKRDVWNDLKLLRDFYRDVRQ
jgi:DNA polymerase